MKNFILGAVNENDEIDIEELRKGARDWYQFVNYDQLPSLIEPNTAGCLSSSISGAKNTGRKINSLFMKQLLRLTVFKGLSGGGEPSNADSNH